MYSKLTFVCSLLSYTSNIPIETTGQLCSKQHLYKYRIAGNIICACVENFECKPPGPTCMCHIQYTVSIIKEVTLYFPSHNCTRICPSCTQLNYHEQESLKSYLIMPTKLHTYPLFSWDLSTACVCTVFPR